MADCGPFDLVANLASTVLSESIIADELLLACRLFSPGIVRW